MRWAHGPFQTYVFLTSSTLGAPSGTSGFDCVFSIFNWVKTVGSLLASLQRPTEPRSIVLTKLPHAERSLKDTSKHHLLYEDVDLL